jgi:hypothetical protein
MRKRAYPGDAPGSLPSIASLVPLYLDLLAGRRGNEGPIMDASLARE